MNVTTSEKHHANIKTNQTVVKSMAADIKKKIDAYLRAAIGKVTGKLNRALRLQNRFILPGAGVFAMKHPKFNNRGDILVDLKYMRFAMSKFDH